MCPKRIKIPDKCKKNFDSNVKITRGGIEKCFDFAKEMTEGEGEHNENSFGSSDFPRDKQTIFRDALQGKIAEIGFYNYFYNKLNIKETPNFEAWGRGEWEDCDFELEDGRKISVKSTKSYGNLLMLEKDRYDEKGYYLETADGSEPIKYDYFFLIRVKNVESYKKIKKKYINGDEYTNLKKVKCEITGYITYEDFLKIIKNDHLLSAGTKLGSTTLKVDNYYVCADHLRTDFIGI